MVNSSGFIFPSGQTTLQYNGITVTNVQGKETFGSSTAQTILTGNIGFATITFGESGELTTKRMPVLFYFSAVDQTGAAKTLQEQGVFGVGSGSNRVVVAGTATPATLSVCNESSFSTCHLVSPFRYFDYASDVRSGFKLDPAPLNALCNMTTWAGCTSAKLLTIGLNNSAESGFSMNALACPGNQPVGGGPDGLSACQPEITATVSVPSAARSFSYFVLFDSGAPSQTINVPVADSTGFPSTLSAGTSVSVTMLSGFAYTYSVGSTGVKSTNLTLNTTSQRSIFGVDYFTGHSFLIDFTNQVEGFK